jgi:uncharacterized lipoprotein YajG
MRVGLGAGIVYAVAVLSLAGCQRQPVQPTIHFAPPMSKNKMLQIIEHNPNIPAARKAEIIRQIKAKPDPAVPGHP